MCEIEITSVIGQDELGNDIGVVGTVSDCPEEGIEGSNVSVRLECAGNSAVRDADVFTDGRWHAKFSNIGCRCGEEVTAIATCTTVEGCEDELVIEELSCIDCSGTGDDDVTLPPFRVGDEHECLITGNAAVPIKIDFTNTLSQFVHINVQCGADAVSGGAGIGVPSGASVTETITCEYETPTTPQLVVIWLLDINFEPIGCPPITLTVPPIEECPCQIDEKPEIGVEVDGCTATFTRTEFPEEDCELTWDFDDGDSITESDESFTHEFPENDTYNVAVSMVCGDCVYPIPVEPVEITDCEEDNGGVVVDDGGDDDEDGGEGFWCGVVRVALAVASAMAILTGLLAICIPAAAPALLLAAAGFAIAAAVLAIIYTIFCPDKPCGVTLLTAAQASLGAGVAAIVLSGCCPWVLWAGIILVLIGLGGLLLWKSQCDQSYCAVAKEITKVIGGIVLPIIGVVGLIPGVAGCISPIASAIVSGIFGPIAAYAASC